MGAEARSKGSRRADAGRTGSATLLARLAPVVALVAAGLLAYLFRTSIVDAYQAARHEVLSAVSLGLLPLALWTAAFGWALLRRRSWLSDVRLWAGTLIFVGAVFGVLSFFRADAGVLGWFGLQGDVTLGGGVGRFLAGTITWIAVFRVLGLFLLAVAVASPPLAWEGLQLFGGLLLSAYVAGSLLAKRLGVFLGRMYRVPEGTKTPEDVDLPIEVEPPVTPARTTRNAGLGHRAAVAQPLSSSRVETPAWAPTGLASTEPSSADPETPADDESELDSWEDTTEQVVPVEEADPEDGDAGPAKFNKFWAGSGNWQSTGHQSGLIEVAASDAAESPGDLVGPIVDAARSAWDKPPMGLLVTTPEGGISKEEMEETAETIRRTLGEYSIEVEIGQIRPGPAVTLYGLVPGWVRRYKQVKQLDDQGRPILDASGKATVRREETKTRVKVDSILSREKDLSLALKTPSIRIETPVMGKSQVGIEVPNPEPELVTLRGVMESEEYRRLHATAHLPIALGKGSGGEAVVADLAKMPHLLIAGATGSGKSVCINTILAGLLMEKSPAEMRLLLIDPKRVEMTPYNGIPHLLTPVVVETDQVVGYLKGMIQEMQNRYRRFEEVGVRNIEAYNRKVPDKMPMLVVAVDELADLMMAASFDVEQSLCRLAQLGRATGIHLIVATQRPSVDVVTGLIKANFPTRISFGVASQIDSRTILDATGADKLLGRGDMLFLALDASRPKRVQGVFISDRESEDIVAFWQKTPWPPLPRVTLRPVKDEKSGADDAGEDDDGAGSRDELMDKAVDLAQRSSKLSTSLLQRRMRIGYPRAARLMDQLEEEGIVGPSDGSKSRDVIIGSV